MAYNSNKGKHYNIYRYKQLKIVNISIEFLFLDVVGAITAHGRSDKSYLANAWYSICRTPKNKNSILKQWIVNVHQGLVNKGLSKI
jgi:hypothetical protein